MRRSQNCVVSISLQKAMKVFQKVFRSGTISPQAEVEDGRSPRSSVLPQKRLMIFIPPIVHLHIDRGLIGLQVAPLN